MNGLFQQNFYEGNYEADTMPKFVCDNPGTARPMLEQSHGGGSSGSRPRHAAGAGSELGSITSPYGASAGVIGQLAMTTLKTNVVVTAVTNTSNILEVIAWNDTGTKLARTGSANGDEIFPLWAWP